MILKVKIISQGNIECSKKVKLWQNINAPLFFSNKAAFIKDVINHRGRGVKQNRRLMIKGEEGVKISEKLLSSIMNPPNVWEKIIFWFVLFCSNCIFLTLLIWKNALKIEGMKMKNWKMEKLRKNYLQQKWPMQI